MIWEVDDDDDEGGGVNLVYDNLWRKVDILSRSRPPQLTLVNLTNPYFKIGNFESIIFADMKLVNKLSLIYEEVCLCLVSLSGKM